jgi:uncharacterized membrane protein
MRRRNVGTTERWGSAVGGVALTVAGLRRLADDDRASGSVMAAIGTGLVWRAATGHCNVYEAAGINTSAGRSDTRARLSGTRGVNVDESVTIDRDASDLYRRWKDLEWLPRVFSDLLSVERLGAGRSRWIASGPWGRRVCWVAEIINDIPERLIAWRTTGDPDLISAGSVNFMPAVGNGGTVVRLRFQYDAPGGKLGAAAAWLMGLEPSQEAREGLRRFKQMMEAGEIASNRMRPGGGK